MKNWLWDKQFAFKAWLKSDMMRYAWKQFINNDFVIVSIIFVGAGAYVVFWALCGYFAYELTGSAIAWIITSCLGGFLSILIAIFVTYYRKAMEIKREHGRIHI
jgi:hypothetical protein